jgi:hypothetical protein
MITRSDHNMDLIILSAAWFFIAVLVINITAVTEYKRGYDAGVASCCPEEIEPDDIAGYQKDWRPE